MRSFFKSFTWFLLLLIVGVTGLLSSLFGGSDPVTVPGDLSGGMAWFGSSKNVFALVAGLIAALGAIGSIAQLLGPSAATEHTVQDLATAVRDVKAELMPSLEVITGFRQLRPEAIRRLPTSLLVAEHGIVPYEDSAGLLRELFDWAEGSAGAPVGRLYVAPAGYGKTRLALEVVTTLNARGWKAGIIPRFAMDRRGAVDAEPDGPLCRLLASRGKGAFLVLDYAEGRSEHIERVAREALKFASGAPICILLLARASGAWWSDLRRESRFVEQVFDARALTLTERPLSIKQAEDLHVSAAKAFARELAKAEAEQWHGSPLSLDEPLPPMRPNALTDRSPLSIAMEAYLSLCGHQVHDSALDEIARDERRHWVRALGIPAPGTDHTADEILQAFLSCVAVSTLIQGLEAFSSQAELDNELHGLVAVALRNMPRSKRTAEEDSAMETRLRTCLKHLYGSQDSSGMRLLPVRPDLVGEAICADALKLEPSLLRDAAAMGERQMTAALVVANRASGNAHGVRRRLTVLRALEVALSDCDGVSIGMVLDVARREPGGVITALVNIAGRLSDDALAQGMFRVDPHHPVFQVLLRSWAEERLFRRLEAEPSANTEKDVATVAATTALWKKLADEGSALVFEAPESKDGPRVEEGLLFGNAARRTLDIGKAREWYNLGYTALRSIKEPNLCINVQMIDHRVSYALREHSEGDKAKARELLDAADVDLRELPTSGDPWYLLGSLTVANASLTILSSGSIADRELASQRYKKTLELLIESGTAACIKVLRPAIQFFANVMLAACQQGDLYVGVTVGELALKLATASNEDQLDYVSSTAPLLVQIYVNLSLVYSEIDEQGKARDASEHAVDAARDCFAIDAKVYRFELAKALDSLAVDELHAGRYAEAVTLESEADQLFLNAELVEAMREREDRAACLVNQAAALRLMGENDQARAVVKSAAELYRDIVKDGPPRHPHMLSRLESMSASLGA